MSTRVTLNVGFYFEKEHYAQLHAYLPRSEAVKIPELNYEDTEKNPEPSVEVVSGKPSKQGRSESKRGSDEEMWEEDENDNLNENENEIEMENQEEEDDDEEDQENLIDQEQQKEVDDVLQQLQEDEEEESSSDSYDSQRQDEGEDMDSQELSSPSPSRNFLNNKTKRQKGETKDLIQLPDRRPRKGKEVDEATEIIRREQKQRKRKQYLKKQIQAQEKATIDKILNETGRQLRKRQEKQMQDELEREQKTYKTLGNTPKIITLLNERGMTVMTHNTPLFPEHMTKTHDVKMKEICSNCGHTSKYKLKECNKFACSLPCYKVLTV